MKDGAKEQFDVVISSETTQFRRKQEPEKKDGSDAWYYLGLVGQIGFAIALPIAAGGIAGVYVDKWLGTQPAATLLLLLIGIGISFAGFFSVIKEASHNPKNF